MSLSGIVGAVFGGLSSQNKQQPKKKSFLDSNPYASLDSAIRAKDSSLAAGREPLQYGGQNLLQPLKSTPAINVAAGIQRKAQQITNNKRKAKALVDATIIKGPSGTPVDEDKTDIQQKLMKYRTEQEKVTVALNDYDSVPIS